jgi:8-oxo-dGTP pyrophosphatase MutT (NUDIX family)
MEKKLNSIELNVKKIGGKFIELYEAEAAHIYADGTKSGPYKNEFIHRKGYDSVAVAVYREENRGISIALRGQIRIPALSRKTLKLSLAERSHGLYLMEVVAGSLETEDKGKNKILERAAAEVYEEAGFIVKPKDIISLGAPFFTSPGQSSEKIFPFAVKVDNGGNSVPRGDGSLLEKDASVVKFIPVEKVIFLINKGEIQDAKTEIVILRLCMRLNIMKFKADNCSS